MSKDEGIPVSLATAGESDKIPSSHATAAVGLEQANKTGNSSTSNYFQVNGRNQIPKEPKEKNFLKWDAPDPYDLEVMPEIKDYVIP